MLIQKEPSLKQYLESNFGVEIEKLKFKLVDGYDLKKASHLRKNTEAELSPEDIVEISDFLTVLPCASTGSSTVFLVISAADYGEHSFAPCRLYLPKKSVLTTSLQLGKIGMEYSKMNNVLNDVYNYYAELFMSNGYYFEIDQIIGEIMNKIRLIINIGFNLGRKNNANQSLRGHRVLSLLRFKQSCYIFFEQNPIMELPIVKKVNY